MRMGSNNMNFGRVIAVGLNQMRLRIPQKKLSVCKNAVEWLIAEWNKNPELSSHGKITSYTGGIFEPGELCQRYEFYTVGVIKCEEAYYIVDLTIHQFKPDKKWLLKRTLPEEKELIKVLEEFYGGKWWNF